MTAVSFVIPILNEARHVRAAVQSVLSQQGLAEREVILVLGRSTDGTTAIVEKLAREHSEIVVIHNSSNAISRSMNLGTAAARFDVVIRVDAHSVLSPDYALRAAESLRAAGAANLGGRMKAEGSTPFESAVAWSYNSRIGLGGAIYHTGTEAGPAESAYLGVFDKAALVDIGGFDETLSRGEDWELNYRLRSSGQLVWFDPSLEVTYRPRSTLRTLAKQFYASGRWRGELIRRLGQRIPLRYFLPPAFVAVLGLGLMLSVVTLVAALFTPVWWVLPVAGVIPALGYLLWVVGATVVAKGISGAAKSRLLVVLPCMHVCWGWGCLLGLFVRSRGLNSLAGR